MDSRISDRAHSRLRAGRSAEFSLHIRRYSLYTSLRSSSESLQQIRQSEEILVAEAGPSGGKFHGRVETRHIRATRQNRLELPVRIEEVDAILAPVLAMGDQVEDATE
jgi:hypothetical protein